MVSGLSLVLGLGTRMQDPHVYAVFGARQVHKGCRGASRYPIMANRVAVLEKHVLASAARCKSQERPHLDTVGSGDPQKAVSINWGSCLWASWVHES